MDARLHTLQARFQVFLLGEGDDAAIRSAIVDDARVGAGRRLKIYHDAYQLRLIEALSESYPKLGLLLGDALFEQMACSYIAAHPSTCRNLRWYGGAFADHLARELPEHPIAAELARFEWALGLAFDSADASLVTRDALAPVPLDAWGALRFALHPSVQVLDLGLNTPGIWKALAEDRAPPAVEQTPASWVIWRQSLSPHFRSLPAEERVSLQWLRDGARFAELCEALAQDRGESEAVALAAKLLSGWMADGLLAGYTLAAKDGP